MGGICIVVASLRTTTIRHESHLSKLVKLLLLLLWHILRLDDARLVAVGHCFSVAFCELRVAPAVPRHQSATTSERLVLFRHLIFLLDIYVVATLTCFLKCVCVLARGKPKSVVEL